MPGRVNDPLSEGCNALIRDGAGVIVSAELFVQMIRELSDQRHALPGIERTKYRTKEKRFYGTPEEALVYTKLDVTPVTPEKLKAETGLSIAQVQRSLLNLQLADLASEVAKNQFVKQK